MRRIWLELYVASVQTLRMGFQFLIQKPVEVLLSGLFVCQEVVLLAELLEGLTVFRGQQGIVQP